MKCRILNNTRGSVAVENARIARSFWQRFSGLMLRKAVSPGQALVFYHAGGIHTMFMRFNLDLVFIDRTMKVVRICRDVAPWRCVWCPGAYATIEMTANYALDKFYINDIIDIKCL